MQIQNTKTNRVLAMLAGSFVAWLVFMPIRRDIKKQQEETDRRQIKIDEYQTHSKAAYDALNDPDIDTQEERIERARFWLQILQEDEAELWSEFDINVVSRRKQGL